MEFNKTFFQGIKFLIVGGLATLADLAFFNILVLIITGNPLIAKSLSFLVSITMKYTGNRYWTFQTHTESPIKKEIVQFIFITIIGLGIDLATFYYATKVAGPQFGLSVHLWTQISVILSALSSAVISFLGYKFLVFKK